MSCLEQFNYQCLFSFIQDHKKLGEQSNKEQETVFGSTPTPARQLTTKKVVAPRANGATGRRLSLNTNQNGSQSVNRDGKRDTRPIAVVNYVTISKEDVPGIEHIPSTP